jgi:hypothetical protein
VRNEESAALRVRVGVVDFRREGGPPNGVTRECAVLATADGGADPSVRLVLRVSNAGLFGKFRAGRFALELTPID